MKYTIVYMRPLGDFDSKFGQKYWGKVEEHDVDVSFNIMNPVNFEEGDQITFEEKATRETKSGKEYEQLKKVKQVSSGSQGVGDEPAATAIKEERKPAPAADSREYQVTRNMAWKNLLNYYDPMKLRPGSETWLAFWDAVEAHTAILLGTKQPNEVEARLSGKQKFQKKLDEIHGQQDVGEDDVPPDWL